MVIGAIKAIISSLGIGGTTDVENRPPSPSLPTRSTIESTFSFREWLSNFFSPVIKVLSFIYSIFFRSPPENREPPPTKETPPPPASLPLQQPVISSAIPSVPPSIIVPLTTANLLLHNGSSTAQRPPIKDDDASSESNSHDSFHSIEDRQPEKSSKAKSVRFAVDANASKGDDAQSSTSSIADPNEQFFDFEEQPPATPLPPPAVAVARPLVEEEKAIPPRIKFEQLMKQTFNHDELAQMFLTKVFTADVQSYEHDAASGTASILFSRVQEITVVTAVTVTITMPQRITATIRGNNISLAGVGSKFRATVDFGRLAPNLPLERDAFNLQWLTKEEPAINILIGMKIPIPTWKGWMPSIDYIDSYAIPAVKMVGYLKKIPENLPSSET